MTDEEGVEMVEIPQEFECAVCMKLLLDPVSTSCGHTFCKTCIERSLDFRTQCPLCRATLIGGTNVNVLIANLIEQRYPDQLRARREGVRDEVREEEDASNQQRQRVNENAEHHLVLLRPDWNSMGAPKEILVQNFEADSVSLAVRHSRQLVMMDASSVSEGSLGVLHQIAAYNETEDSGRRLIVVGTSRVRLHSRIQQGVGSFIAVSDTPLSIEELSPDPNAATISVRDIAKDCEALVAEQGQKLGHAGKAQFDAMYGRPPSLPQNLTSASLEKFSFWIVNAINMPHKTKLQCFNSTDTRQRLDTCRNILRNAGSGGCLNMPGTGSLFNPRSVGGTLLMLIAFIVVIVMKNMGYFDQTLEQRINQFRVHRPR